MYEGRGWLSLPCGSAYALTHPQVDIEGFPLL